MLEELKLKWFTHESKFGLERGQAHNLNVATKNKDKGYSKVILYNTD